MRTRRTSVRRQSWDCRTCAPLLAWSTSASVARSGNGARSGGNSWYHGCGRDRGGMDRGAMPKEIDNRRSRIIHRAVKPRPSGRGAVTSAEVGQAENLPIFGACASCPVYLVQKHGQIESRTRRMGPFAGGGGLCQNRVEIPTFRIDLFRFPHSTTSWEAPR